ncbi:hypothetical protein D3C85_668980 [compost metagenome]
MSKRAADAPHEQGNDCQQQQQCPAGTRQYDGRLLEALVANAHQLLERLAASASGRKGVVAGILDQLREQVKTRQHDKHPHQFIGEEASQRDVADHKAARRQHNHDGRTDVHQPGQGGPSFWRLSAECHLPPYMAGTQQQYTDDQCRHQGHHAPAKNGHGRAHAHQIGHLHQRPHDHQHTGQYPRIRLDDQGHRIGNRRQTPGRLTGGQQGPAQTSDHHAREGDPFHFFQVIKEHHRQGSWPGQYMNDQMQGKQGCQDRGQCHGDRQRTAPEPPFGQPVNAPPRQCPLDQPPSQRPYRQGQQQQPRGTGAQPWLPGRVQDLRDLGHEPGKALPVFLHRVYQRSPETGAKDTATAQGQFGFQLVTTDAGQLQGKVARTGLDGIQCLQIRVQMVLAPADLGPLQCDCRLLRCSPGRGRRAQYFQLRLQLGLLRQQQGDFGVDVSDQLLEYILQPDQLVIVAGN